MGRELRAARRGLGLRQVDVASAAGVTRGWVSKVELGNVTDIGVRTLAVLAAVVGLDLRVRAYPGGAPYRDEGHRAPLARFRALLPAGAPWRTEVPLPIAGDQRAWDAMTTLWSLRVGIEAEMRPSDLQALQRKLALKVRDGGVDRLILVLADTKANRATSCGSPVRIWDRCSGCRAATPCERCACRSIPAAMCSCSHR
jgi:transcriptional regulator with XRE-family HTH domain